MKKPAKKAGFSEALEMDPGLMDGSYPAHVHRMSSSTQEDWLGSWGERIVGVH
jgi:hypothetical protein